MPTKTWAVGEEVLAADFNTYVQRQVVPTFNTVAERTAAMPSPTVGQMSMVAGWPCMYRNGIWQLAGTFIWAIGGAGFTSGPTTYELARITVPSIPGAYVLEAMHDVLVVGATGSVNVQCTVQTYADSVALGYHQGLAQPSKAVTLSSRFIKTVPSAGAAAIVVTSGLSSDTACNCYSDATNNRLRVMVAPPLL